jgi:xanthine dehydrogenase YagR molybdenum-binding subunit
MSSHRTPVGKPVARVDGALKVAGRAEYAADGILNDVAYGVIVPSSVARGTIERIDVDEAAEQSGVLAVLTHLNAPRLAYHEHRGSPDPDCGERLHVLQSPAIHFFGQPVAVVVAETREEAEYAATLLRVQYVQLPVDLELSFERSVTPGSCRGACADFESDTSRGDADAALGSAAVRLDRLYGIARQNHHPIEPHAAIAAWDGGQLTLRTKSQFVVNERDEIAAVFGIPADNVRVMSPFVGGAFGSALRTWPHVVIAALCARELHRTVSVQLDRRQMATLTGSRPESRQRVALGAARDGRLAAIVHEVVHETSRYEEYVEDVLDVSTYLYSCPNVRTRYRIAPRDVSTPTWMRGPGEASGIFALECAMDELAAQLGMDPVELRVRNEPERDEREGLPFSSRNIKECYRAAAEHFGWARRTAEPRSMRDGDTLIGWGMAASTYPAYFSDGAEASIRLHRDGTVEVAAASSDMGPGTYTSLTQVAADAMGVDMERVRVRLGDSTLPRAPSHGGSQTLASVGAAVRAACEAAHQEVRRLGAEDSGFVAALESSDRESIEVCGRSAASRGSDRFSKHAFGAVFAEVTVDAVSCELRVRRLVGAYAAGRIVNARLARSQCIGGMVGGIGMALMEETVLDERDGRIVTGTLAEYLVPVNLDVRGLEVLFIDEQDPHVNTLGVKGIAEIALVGVAPAIANAVYHATGRRIRSLPITLDRLL